MNDLLVMFVLPRRDSVDATEGEEEDEANSASDEEGESSIGVPQSESSI